MEKEEDNIETFLKNFEIDKEKLFNGKKCVEKALEYKENKKYLEGCLELRRGIDLYQYHGCWLELKKDWVLNNLKFKEEDLIKENTAGSLWFLGRAQGYGYHGISCQPKKCYANFVKAGLNLIIIYLKEIWVIFLLCYIKQDV
jgi:hypothetical protein